MQKFEFQGLRHLSIQKITKLGQLSKCLNKNISLSICQFQGKNIFEKMHNLKNYDFVEIDVIKFRRSLPKNLLEKISPIQNLKSLTLTNGNINTIEDNIDLLQELEYLKLQQMGKGNLPQSISQLKLKGLYISATIIQNLDIILSMESLEELVIYSKHIPDDFVHNLHQLKNLKVLGLNHAFKKGQFPESFKTLTKLAYLNFKSHKIKTIPDFFTQYKDLYHFRLNHHKDLNWTQYLTVLSQLPKIKTLDLSNNRLCELSNSIGLMKQIEVLDISNNDLKDIPEEICTLENLEEVRFDKNPALIGNPVFYKTLAKIPKLKKISFSVNKESIPDTFNLLTQIDCIAITNSTDIDFSPCQNKKITNIKTLISLDNSSEQDIFQALNHIIDISQLEKLHIDTHTLLFAKTYFPSMKNLKSLRLKNTAQITIDKIFATIGAVPQLEEFICYGNNSIKLANIFINTSRLRKFRLDYVFDKITGVKALIFPQEMMHLDKTTFESNVPKLFNRLNTYFEYFSATSFSPAEKLMAYAIINNNTTWIKDKFKNPFTADSFNPQNTKVLFSGTIKGFDQKEIREKLKSYGFVLTYRFNKNIKYAIMGNDCTTELLHIAMSNKDCQIVFEEQIRAFFIQQDNPYLLAEDSENISENIKTLLISEDKENIQLAFQMLKGGGLNTELLTYFTAVYLFFPDKEIRKQGKKIFEMYAPDSLQKHIKAEWKNEFRGNQNANAIQDLANHDTLNRGLFTILFYKIFWYNMAGNYAEIHWMLDYPIPKEVTILDNLIMVSFRNNQAVQQINSSLDNLMHMPSIVKIDLSSTGFDYFPTQLLSMKNLCVIHLNNNHISHLPENIDALSNLESLYLNTNPLKTLPASFAKLSKLRLVKFTNCRLTSIEVLTKMPIAQLYLDNNRITEIPYGFSTHKTLQYFVANYNKISTIADDFGDLPTLEGLSIKHNNISALPDIIDWSALKYAHVSFNKISKFPENISKLSNVSSLIFDNNALAKIPEMIATLHALKYLKLDHNNIKRIPESLQACKDLQELYLSFNCITAFPRNFEQFESIIRLNLSNNKITTLPKALPSCLTNDNASFYHYINLSGNPIKEKERIEGKEKFNKIRF